MLYRKSRRYIEAKRVLDYLSQRGVKQFIRFTSLENLESVLEYGLIPHGLVDKEKLAYQVNDQFRYDGLDHVNLSITHSNVNFFYKTRKLFPEGWYAVLAINPKILLKYAGDEAQDSYLI